MNAISRKWGERTTQIGVALIFIIAALVARGSMTLADAYLPWAFCAILILAPEAVTTVVQAAPLLPGGQALGPIAQVVAKAEQTPVSTPASPETPNA